MSISINSTESNIWSWGKSLLLKSGILGMGIAVVMWAGWPQPAPRSEDPALLSSSNLQATSILSFDSSPESFSVFTVKTLQQTEIVRKKRLQDSAVGFLVDLNLSSSIELETLPGIGKKLANRIVAYRSIHGVFQKVHDLLKVSGIGEKRLKRLEPFVKV